MVSEWTQEKVDKLYNKASSFYNKLPFLEQQEFDKFVEDQVNGKWYYFDSLTYVTAFQIRQRLLDDYDAVTVITGREGTGKSTFASQYAKVISPNTSIKRVCYKPSDFLEAVKGASKGDTVWIDEGGLFLFSRESLSGVNRNIVKLLTICRQLNLHLIICVPNFFILDTYIRDHRVNQLFHLRSRGTFFRIFGEGIPILSKEGRYTKKVEMVINKIPTKCRFQGHFNKMFGETPFLTQKMYEDAKSANMLAQLDEWKLFYEEWEEIKPKDNDMVKVAKSLQEKKVVSNGNV